MRTAFRLLWLIGLLLLCVPLHLLRRLFRIRSPWPQRFLGWAGRAIGIKLEIIGEPAPAPALIASNHQSWIDILLIGGATGASFVAKDGVRKWPVAGWLAAMVGTIFISNKDRGAAAHQADTIRAALDGGKSVAFFPEGKIDNGILLPFRPALFGAIVPPSAPAVPVQPVAIDYGPDKERIIWRRGTKATKNLFAVLGMKGLRDVRLHLCPAITPTADDNRRHVCAQCETAIAEALGIALEREVV